MSATSRRLRVAAVLAGSMALVACQQKMAVQPSYKPLEPSSFFSDGRSARPLPEGAIAREALTDDYLRTGMENGAPGDAFPFPVTAEVLQRGQQRFAIYCAVCHGDTGEGDGMIVRRGFSPPPSYHSDQLRNAPVGHLFDVMTNGFGAMPGYAEQVPARDRWAIAAYIRALQLSQHATVDDVPADHRGDLASGGQR